MLSARILGKPDHRGSVSASGEVAADPYQADSDTAADASEGSRCHT